MVKRKRSETPSIHDKAIALCEKRNVWFNGHTIRLVEAVKDDISCRYCEMDSLCDSEMEFLCCECEVLLRKPCILKLVSTL